MQEPSVDPFCVQAFNEMKSEQKYRYIVYRLTEDSTKIIVEKTAPANATYEDFKDDMYKVEADRDCRYGVINCEYTHSDGQKKKELLFMLWSPECARIGQKMRYASSKDVLKKALGGVEKYLQANDHKDLDWKHVMEVIINQN